MEIKQTSFDGLRGILVTTGIWRMVLITEIGPRIAYLGRENGGKNILYWDKEGGSHGDWKLYGGHRCWLTRPWADESEDTYAADNQPCAVELGTDYAAAVAPAHPFTKLARGIRVEVLGEASFAVTNFICNEGGMISSGGVWSPTCISPQGKTITIPLGEDDSTWDIVKVMIPRVFAGNTARLDDPQVRFTADALVIKPEGLVCKRCVCAPKGTIRLEWPEQKIAFTKRTRYLRGANYPLDGCNIAAFVGDKNWMGELETYGPEQPIRPGETIYNTEKWELENMH